MAVIYSRCCKPRHQIGVIWDAKESALICFCKTCEEEAELEIQRKADFRARYADYLKTPHWLTLRAAKLKKAGFRCQLCNGRQKLEVHHRTYEALGNESLEDLIVLCRSCHGRFHRKARK